MCVIDIYRKYAWIITMKDKTGITVTNALLKVLDESGHENLLLRKDLTHHCGIKKCVDQ